MRTNYKNRRFFAAAVTGGSFALCSNKKLQNQFYTADSGVYFT